MPINLFTSSTSCRYITFRNRIDQFLTELFEKFKMDRFFDTQCIGL